MSTFLHVTAFKAVKQIDDPWIPLYKRLQTLTSYWVYNAHVNAWYGQEDDVACDIVLFAVERTYEYSLKAERDGIAILSLEKLSVKIARNYFLDLLRKERRIVHFDQEDSLPGNRVCLSVLVDPSEIAFDMLYMEWFFTQIANAVVTFPDGTRTALLIDLASRMHFDDAEPTPLQLAFLEVGIRLQDYQHLLPKDAGAKSRHASLVSIAYKRLRKVICLMQYDSAA
jgi:DNA-directed RNA polymerase specialized sigma24 family protein